MTYNVFAGTLNPAQLTLHRLLNNSTTINQSVYFGIE